MVRASRNWTCIRLATYEDAAEAEYLEGVFTGRSGQLENTVFTFMNPQASQHLVNPGRGPRQLFRGSIEMAEWMNRTAANHGIRSSHNAGELPKVATLRLALNIAACEGLPVVMVTSQEAERKLLEAAWAPQNLGQAVYVRSELQDREGAFLLKPDKFGQNIESSRPLDLSITADRLFNLLAASQTSPKDHRNHVQEGFSKGVRWETEVPVTDPQARY